MLLEYLWLTIMLWLKYAEEWLVGGVICLELVFCTGAAYGLSQQQNGFVAVPVAWAVAALIHLRTWIQVSNACSKYASHVSCQRVSSSKKSALQQQYTAARASACQSVSTKSKTMPNGATADVRAVRANQPVEVNMAPHSCISASGALVVTLNHPSNMMLLLQSRLPLLAEQAPQEEPQGARRPYFVIEVRLSWLASKHGSLLP